jgi:hypothetical protein
VFQGMHMLMQMSCSSQGDVMPWGPSVYILAAKH